MGDLLVRLYDLPDRSPAIAKVAAAGIRLKRPLSAERSLVCHWVRTHFSERWSDEVEMAFSGQPVTCLAAMDESARIVGFACYDTTFRGFFGPTGVLEECRGRGIGTALLLSVLRCMADAGYAYAVIGGSGADEYYAKTVGATPIPGSTPGPYRDWLKET